MNNSDSAKKGFKTFILTLSISLMIFSAIYYALTKYSPQDSAFIDNSEVASVSTPATVAELVETSEKPFVQGAKDEKPVAKEVSNKDTLFGQIIEYKPGEKPQVLAGTTVQATQSTTAVPTTGVIEMTVGLIISLALFVGAMVYNFMDPRRLALSRFERRAIKRSR